MSSEKKLAYFRAQKKLLCLLSLKYFAKGMKTCLRTVYCLMRGVFTFECSLVELYEQKSSPSSVTTTKLSLILTLILNEGLS